MMMTNSQLKHRFVEICNEQMHKHNEVHVYPVACVAVNITNTHPDNYHEKINMLIDYYKADLVENYNGKYFDSSLE